MTAGNILLIILGKFALGGALFFILVSFGLWLGRIGFMTDREGEVIS